MVNLGLIYWLLLAQSSYEIVNGWKIHSKCKRQRYTKWNRLCTKIYDRASDSALKSTFRKTPSFEFWYSKEEYLQLSVMTIKNLFPNYTFF
jgi:hypothetical protein